MADTPMTPEEYARFMGQTEDDHEAEGSPKKQKGEKLSSQEIDRIRLHLKQAGVTPENIDKVMAKVPDLRKGDQEEFNFIRGHIRRVRIRRELSGKITLIPF